MNQENKNNNFIKKSILKHGVETFNYSNVKYINTTTQLNLICNKHDFSFMVTPVSHFKGMGGCPLCYKEVQHQHHKNKKTGQKFKTNEGYDIEIIDYFTSTNCTILFDDGTIVTNKNYSDIQRGEVKNPSRLIKLGVGYIGVGSYSSIKHLEAYKKWYNMLNRAYNNIKKFISYKDVTVCEEWHNFQIFSDWFYNNYNPKIMQNFHLDKDILVKGNKIYSPETCCLVPQEINSLFLKSNGTRGLTPIGTTMTKNKNFSAKFKRGDKITCFGIFNTPEEAFQAYKTAKENHIKEVADKWRDQIAENVYQAMCNYKVEIDD